MATVPMIDLPTQSASAGGFTPVAAPTVEPMRDFTGEQLQKLGAAEQGAGIGMMSVGRKIQADINDTKTKQLYGMAADKFDAIETKFGSLVGQDAYAKTPEALAEMKKAFDDVEELAENDEQRLMFVEAAKVRLRSGVSLIGKHSAGQFKVYETGEYKANIKGMVRDSIKMADTWRDVDVDGESIGEFTKYKKAALALASSEDAARIFGFAQGSEQQKQFIQEVQTSIVDGAVRSFISNDKMPDAKDFLDKAIAKGEVQADKVDDLRGLVKSAGVKDESLRLSMSLKGGMNAQLSSVDQMFRDGKISADVRDATVQRIEHNDSVRKSNLAESNKSMMGNAQMWILENPTKPVIDMPVEMRNWAQREGHLAGLDAFAQRSGGPAERKKELTVRGQLMSQAMTDPDSFIKEFKETAFTTKLDLGAQGIKEMQNIAADMIGNNGKYKTVFDTKVLQDAVPKALLKNDKKDQRDAFMAIMSEKQREWQKNNAGKQPDQAAYNFVTKAANEEWISIGFMNSTEPAYKIRAGADEKAVPKDFYQSMKALKATDDEIIKAWNLKKSQK